MTRRTSRCPIVHTPVLCVCHTCAQAHMHAHTYTHKTQTLASADVHNDENSWTRTTHMTTMCTPNSHTHTHTHASTHSHTHMHTCTRTCSHTHTHNTTDTHADARSSQHTTYMLPAWFMMACIPLGVFCWLCRGNSVPEHAEQL